MYQIEQKIRFAIRNLSFQCMRTDFGGNSNQVFELFVQKKKWSNCVRQMMEKSKGMCNVAI